jgi:hypothetical protein
MAKCSGDSTQFCGDELGHFFSVFKTSSFYFRFLIFKELSGFFHFFLINRF